MDVTAPHLFSLPIFDAILDRLGKSRVSVPDEILDELAAVEAEFADPLSVLFEGSPARKLYRLLEIEVESSRDTTHTAKPKRAASHGPQQHRISAEKEKQIRRAVELSKTGLTQTEIAAELGISQPRVSQLLRIAADLQIE